MNKGYKKGNVEIGLSGALYYIAVQDSRQNTMLLGLGTQELLDIKEGISQVLETPTVKERMYSEHTGHLIICSSQSGSPFDCHVCNPTKPSSSEKEECCANCNGRKNQSNSISSVCSGYCLCHKS